MRKIKFRGKFENEWVYGSLSYLHHLKRSTQTCIDNYVCDDNTICQFIGINDASGNEVYEYDVVHDGTSPVLYVVFFSTSNLQFMRCQTDYFTGTDDPDTMFHSHQITLEWWNRVKRFVIGNIIDHPYFLETTKVDNHE